MSVKKQLASLREKSKSLEKQISEANSTLEKLKGRRDELKVQKEEYSARTSELAKSLFAKTQKKLDEYEEQIALVESQLEKLQSNLSETRDDIGRIESDPTQYIMEQIERMVPETLDYIKAHCEEIGTKIRKEFRVECEAKRVDDRYGAYNVPTGNLSIIACDYESDGLQPKERISITRDYYFDKSLWNSSQGAYEETYVHYTDWFKRYISMFTKCFLEKLQDEYNFADFKLTITDSGFILELV